MLDLGSYPGVCKSDDYQIYGELYEVNDEIFERLDCLEGYPSFYNREETPIIVEGGKPYIAYIYYIENPDQHCGVEMYEGVWREEGGAFA